MANDSASTGAAAPAGTTPSGLAPPEFDVALLVKEHQAGLWRYLRVLGCPDAEVEDLTQETFLTVLTRPCQHHNRQATAAYRRQGARSLYIGSRRQAVAVAELDEAEAAWLRWAVKDDGQELLAALKKCLQSLTRRAKKALDLRFGREATRA